MAAPVAGGWVGEVTSWAGAVISWAGAVMSWAGAVKTIRILKGKCDQLTDQPTDRDKNNNI